jgi:hypothetical protein
MPTKSDVTRAVSRHTLSYMLCSVSEMFRHYSEFAAIDLLIIHGILNANVTNVMRDMVLDKQFSAIDAVEPDAIKRGVSRAALSRFLNLPLETIRRRVAGLKRLGILTETPSGLIVSEINTYGFGNNHELQATNMLLVRKLLRDLQAAGVSGPDDLLQGRGKPPASEPRLPRTEGRQRTK